MIETLTVSCQNITTLEIDLEIEGEVFEYGVENYDWITNLKSLKKLDLKCDWHRPLEIEAPLKHDGFYVGVDDWDFEKFERYPMLNLQELHVSSVYPFADGRFLIKLHQICPKLHTLVIKGVDTSMYYVY